MNARASLPDFFVVVVASILSLFWTTNGFTLDNVRCDFITLETWMLLSFSVDWWFAGNTNSFLNATIKLLPTWEWNFVFFFLHLNGIPIIEPSPSSIECLERRSVDTCISFKLINHSATITKNQIVIMTCDNRYLHSFQLMQHFIKEEKRKYFYRKPWMIMALSREK